MVATPIEPQRLPTRNDNSEQASWTPMQIATPIIVGVALLLIMAAYLIWQRHPPRKRSYDYHQLRSQLVTKMERMFVLRRKRVVRSSAPITLDDSMLSSPLRLDFRRARQYRSGSSDSQTPLTSTTYPFDYPPSKRLSDSPPPPPVPKRSGWRWWWLFGSRPQEIKSQEPGSRWRVDDPDASTNGHGSHLYEAFQARYTRLLEAVRENHGEIGDDVIRIGENFASVASTPMAQRFPEQPRTAPEMLPVAEHPTCSNARTPTLVASVTRSNPGTPASANRSLPPSYDVSQSQLRYTSVEDLARLPRSDPRQMIIPPPGRTVPYSSPRALHGRELSTESFLAAQPPMVATSIY